MPGGFFVTIQLIQNQAIALVTITGGLFCFLTRKYSEKYAKLIVSDQNFCVFLACPLLWGRGSVKKGPCHKRGPFLQIQ
jgi:hypothetical protein